MIARRRRTDGVPEQLNIADLEYGVTKLQFSFPSGRVNACEPVDWSQAYFLPDAVSGGDGRIILVNEQPTEAVAP
jgi:hypothetical protein